MTNEGQLPMMKNMLRTAMESGFDMSLFHCYILTEQRSLASYKSREFKTIVTRKLEVILHNMKLDNEILWIDNDIVLFQNCIDDLRKYTGSFVMQDDVWSPCTGFFLARTHSASLKAIRDCITWLKMRRIDYTKNDQHAFLDIYRSIENLTVTLLPKEEYPNGYIYFEQKSSNNPKMVHCNFLKTTPEKVERLKEHGLWNPTETAFELANKYYI